MNRVNRLITAWPADDALPAEGLEGVKANYKRLVSGLNDIKTQSDRDVKYARVDVEDSRSCNFSCLIPFLGPSMKHSNGSGCLSRCGKLPKPHHKVRPRFTWIIGPQSQSPPPPPPPSLSVETRTKRPRAHSPQPSSTPLAPASVGSARNSSTPAQRGSTGPQPSTPTLRETKPRSLRDMLLRQAPLQEGRMVAFHPPSSGKGADGTSPEDTTWIMAKIVKASHQDKYRYVRKSSAYLNLDA